MNKRIDNLDPKLYTTRLAAQTDASELMSGDSEWKYVVRQYRMEEPFLYLIDVYDENMDYVGHWS